MTTYALKPVVDGWRITADGRLMRGRSIWDYQDALRQLRRLRGVPICHDEPWWDIYTDAYETYLDAQLEQDDLQCTSAPTTSTPSCAPTILDTSTTRRSSSCKRPPCLTTGSCSCSTKSSGPSTSTSDVLLTA